MKYLLNGNDWYLTGWVKHQWHYEKMMETGGFSVPAVAPIKAIVPGSVQTDLLNAGIIEDWNIETNFRNIEWIEHREWVYTKKFILPEISENYILHFGGLDFCGLVFFNNVKVLEFNQMHLEYSVEVTDYIENDKENELKIVFLQPPEVDGQVGYTSRVSTFKSRFNYGWDWCPRLVNIGIFRDVELECVNGAFIKNCDIKTDIKDDKGELQLNLEIEAFKDKELVIEALLKNKKEIVADFKAIYEVEKGGKNVAVSFSDLDVQKWYPLGFGKQPLYDFEISISSKEGKIISRETNKIGFRNLSYAAPLNAPEGCLKYNPVINGKFIPLRGINWVPISPFYGSVTQEQYYFYLKRFADMGCNLIRIWGGALQESEIFYNICDELGILVWQEFPQSSSGIDNATNERKEYIKNLKIIAKEFISRAKTHVSTAFFCGGNELYLGEELYPIDEKISENLRGLKETVEKYGAGIYFLPASPSKYESEEEQKGKWENGDCHGPWLYEIDKHYDVVDNSKSVLFSEIGAPACSRTEILRKYAKSDIWPPDYTNNYWASRGAWWIQYKEMKSLFGEFESFSDKLEAYSAAFRFTQAEALRYMAEALRKAGDKKSGIIIWMGNEPFPNAANTSVLEFDGCPKPAYYKLKKAYSTSLIGLSYKSPIADENKVINAVPFVASDEATKFGSITLSVYNETGEKTHQFEFSDIETKGVLNLGEISFQIKGEMALLRASCSNIPDIADEWVFVPRNPNPFKTLIDREKTKLSIERLSGSEYKITNNSATTSLFNEVIGKNAEDKTVLCHPNYFCLLGGESITVKAECNIEKISIYQMNQKN